MTKQLAPDGRSTTTTPRKRRPEPQHAPGLAHLSLAELREHRQELGSEETRVSYWRRILQGRHDLIVQRGDPVARGRLRAVLADHTAASRHLAVQRLDPADVTPPLPELAELWDDLDQGSAARHEEVLARLTAAERQLSAYRTSLHQRIDAATDELVARYREQPSLALSALPIPRTG